MKNKPSFQDLHLLTLTAACLAMAALGCSKTDSLGSVSDGGKDGVGKDGIVGNDGGYESGTYLCQMNADGTCSAVTPNTSCLPVRGSLYDQEAKCISNTGDGTLYCTAWRTDAPGGLAPAEGCLQVPQDGGALIYRTPESDINNPWWKSHECDSSLTTLVMGAAGCGSSPTEVPEPATPASDGGVDAVAPTIDATPSCTVQVFSGNVSDCSTKLPVPCSPCIACAPFAPGDTGGCGAPDISLWSWKGGGVDMTLRYPVGCTVYLPTENPYYRGGPQPCTCSLFASSPTWSCPL